MTGRRNPTLRIAAAMVPMILAIAGLMAYIAYAEREASYVRYLEGVRAMSIAVDTELDGSIRVLRALSLAPEIDMAHLQAFSERLSRYQATQPLWTVIAIGDPSWKEVVAVSRDGTAPAKPAIEPRTLMHIAQTRAPAISPLIRTDERHYETQVTVPVIRNAQMVGILMVSIDPGAWLRLLREYPSVPGATMTLLDQDGLIIARTLNPETWVGKPPAPMLRDRWLHSTEASYRSIGLEGQSFYSAFSRSPRTGWTVATGIPAETVEANRSRVIAVAGGAAAVCVGLSILLAFFFGRRL